MKRQLEKKQYELLKEIDFSEIEEDIVFDDNNCTFETTSDQFDIVFNDYIVSHGMDDRREQCTEYGKELYALYDLIFFSDYGKIED